MASGAGSPNPQLDRRRSGGRVAPQSYSRNARTLSCSRSRSFVADALADERVLGEERVEARGPRARARASATARACASRATNAGAVLAVEAPRPRGGGGSRTRARRARGARARAAGSSQWRMRRMRNMRGHCEELLQRGRGDRPLRDDARDGGEGIAGPEDAVGGAERPGRACGARRRGRASRTGSRRPLRREIGGDAGDAVEPARVRDRVRRAERRGRARARGGSSRARAPRRARHGLGGLAGRGLRARERGRRVDEERRRLALGPGEVHARRGERDRVAGALDRGEEPVQLRGDAVLGAREHAARRGPLERLAQPLRAATGSSRGCGREDALAEADHAHRAEVEARGARDRADVDRRVAEAAARDPQREQVVLDDLERVVARERAPEGARAGRRERLGEPRRERRRPRRA